MKCAYNLRAVVRTFQLLAISKLSAVMLVVAAPAAAQTVVPVAPFRSVELHDGGHVILRHGPTQTVTLLKGSTDCAQFTMADGGRLVIDKYKGQCRRKYELEIEIITPYIAEILVADGGTIQSRGSFPRQAEIGVAVRSGGTIDIRSMVLDRVTASVEEGGRIFITPQIALSASVVNGGLITYWGDARVESSIRHGGVVTKGDAAEADKPLLESSPLLPSPPSPPSPRPIQPLRNLLWHQRSKARITATEPVNVQQNLISRYILPAVRVPGDDKSAPMKERDYVTPYSRSPILGPVKR